MQARKETQAYKQLVETGKKLDKIEERKKRKAAREGKTLEESESVFNKKQKVRQIPEIDDNGKKPTKKALLGSLV
jgi:hypothetical protein